MSDLRDSIRKYHENMHPEHLGFTIDTLSPELLAFRRKLDTEETEEVDEAWDELEVIRTDETTGVSRVALCAAHKTDRQATDQLSSSRTPGGPQ